MINQKTFEMIHGIIDRAVCELQKTFPRIEAFSLDDANWEYGKSGKGRTGDLFFKDDTTHCGGSFKVSFVRNRIVKCVALDS